MSKHDPHVTLLQVYDFTKEGIDLATQGSLGRLDSDRAYLRAAERIICQGTGKTRQVGTGKTRHFEGV
jgi:hypothetical protein